ncbi:hypothetical protein [Natribacillus halophilus]|uniref:Uncharacterized protein n=1 Tax=Natribacillus halophilus TaxID=549003 RepID=A0A1G8KRH3_9BACI|nr:hypothetical protein [Natribacillus halophilus]SDI45959.1 hypothetical protein SAMN04488123_102261 [Natribacillus halophilus]
MGKRDNTCTACDGTGLLMDDEQWKYPCTICNGDGIFMESDNPDPDHPINVDDNNRTLE